MARRRSEENGQKRQQRIEREERDRQPSPDTAEQAVPPGVTQLVEPAAPPFVAPRPEE